MTKLDTFKCIISASKHVARFLITFPSTTAVLYCCVICYYYKWGWGEMRGGVGSGVGVGVWVGSGGRDY